MAFLSMSHRKKSTLTKKRFLGDGIHDLDQDPVENGPDPDLTVKKIRIIFFRIQDPFDQG